MWSWPRLAFLLEKTSTPLYHSRNFWTKTKLVCINIRIGGGYAVCSLVFMNLTATTRVPKSSPKDQSILEMLPIAVRVRGAEPREIHVDL